MATNTENVTVGENENNDTCEIEATVATGFEQTAREELEEKLNVTARAARGKVVATIPIQDVKKVLDLGCVDNIRVMMTTRKNMAFPKDQLECMGQLRDLVRDVDWDRGLTVWKQVYTFPHPIHSAPISENVVFNEPFLTSRVNQPKKQVKDKKGRSGKGDKFGGRGNKHGGKGDKKGRDGKVKREEKRRNPDHVDLGNGCGDRGQVPDLQYVGDEGRHIQDNANMGCDFNFSNHGNRIVEHQFSDAESDHELKKNNITNVENSMNPVLNTQTCEAELTATIKEMSLVPDSEKPVVDKDIIQSGSPWVETDNDAQNNQRCESPMDVDKPEESAGKTESDLSASAEKLPSQVSSEELPSQVSSEEHPPKSAGLEMSSSVDPEGFQPQLSNQQEEPAVATITSGPITDESPAASSANPQKELAETFPQHPESTSPKPKLVSHDPLMPSFRVTCNRVGDNHSFDSMCAAANFGGAVQEYFGWNVDMKNFHIEVMLHIDGNEVAVGIGLTKESLHKRNITVFGATTLRPTIAYNMLRMCQIQPGEVVCDPMCGSGSIPIQASRGWPEAFHLSGEKFTVAADRTMQNVTALNTELTAEHRKPISVDCAYWDATYLPLRDSSVDVFITDLPFGKRMGSRFSNQRLYPEALYEMARVCRPGSGRVCLLTQDKKCMIKTIQTLGRFWQRRTTLGVNLGGLSAGVYLLTRTLTLTASKHKTQKVRDDSAEDFHKQRESGCQDFRASMPSDPRSGAEFKVIRHTFNSSSAPVQDGPNTPSEAATPDPPVLSEGTAGEQSETVDSSMSVEKDS